MPEIDRAQEAAMRTLNGWVDAIRPNFNVIELAALRQRMTATFREYETRIAEQEGINEALTEERDDLLEKLAVRSRWTVVWVISHFGKRCVWGSFREAWADYMSFWENERDVFWKTRLYPKLMRNVNYNRLPEHTGW